MIDVCFIIFFAIVFSAISLIATLDRAFDKEYAVMSAKVTKMIYAITLASVSLIINFFYCLQETTETFDLVKTDSKRYVYFDGSFVNLSRRFERNFDGDTVNIKYCKKNQTGIFGLVTNYNDILVGIAE